MKRIFITKSVSQTKKLGEKIAKEISEKKKKNILALCGDLGGGKTTFVQGFANFFKIKKIKSPTFLLIKKFKIKNHNFSFLYHLDFYRIEKKEELIKLGFKKIIKDQNNVVLVEWAEKFKDLFPKEKTLWIKFNFLDKKKREIIIG